MKSCERVNTADPAIDEWIAQWLLNVLRDEHAPVSKPETHEPCFSPYLEAEAVYESESIYNDNTFSRPLFGFRAYENFISNFNTVETIDSPHLTDSNQFTLYQNVTQEIEEEYCRVLKIRNSLCVKKEVLEAAILQRFGPESQTQRLLFCKEGIQKAEHSTRCIEQFMKQYFPYLSLDFEALKRRHPYPSCVNITMVRLHLASHMEACSYFVSLSSYHPNDNEADSDEFMSEMTCLFDPHSP